MLVHYKADIIIIALNISCSRHDIAEKLLNWHSATISQSLYMLCDTFLMQNYTPTYTGGLN